MSIVKAVHEGLKWIVCEHDVGSKNSHIQDIPKQDHVQDALKKNKKTNYFKLTLPLTGSKLKVAILVSGTLEEFLLYVHTAIHACKQRELDANLKEAEIEFKSVNIDLDITKAK